MAAARVVFHPGASEHIDWAPRIVKALGGSRRAKIDRWLAERVFVSCALDGDLPHVINKLGDDFVVTATDFPHGDAFRQDQLAQGLKKRGDLKHAAIDKLLSANLRRRYSMAGEYVIFLSESTFSLDLEFKCQKERCDPIEDTRNSSRAEC